MFAANYAQNKDGSKNNKETNEIHNSRYAPIIIKTGQIIKLWTYICRAACLSIIVLCLAAVGANLGFFKINNL